MPAGALESGGKAAGEKLEALGKGTKVGEITSATGKMLEKGGEKTHELLEKGGDKVKELGEKAGPKINEMEKAAGEKIKAGGKAAGEKIKAGEKAVVEEFKDLKDKAKDMLKKKEAPAPKSEWTSGGSQEELCPGAPDDRGPGIVLLLRLLASRGRRMIDDQRPLTAWVSNPDDALSVSASGGIEIAGPFERPRPDGVAVAARLSASPTRR